MTSVVQDVGSERGVGGGGHDGPGGGHGHHRRSGGGRDPQLLEVDGGEALALGLHLLQHPDQSEESMRTILTNERRVSYLVVRLVVGDSGLNRRNRVE